MVIYDNVTIQYGKVVALKAASFSIQDGEFVYIVGPNGSGKTTLVKGLVGLIKPAVGTIYNDEEFIGYLPQKLKTDFGFPITVREIIYSGFKKQSLLISDEATKLIKEWLDYMEIPHVLNEQMSVLSIGQQQRVYLIRALVSNPKLVILDEPTSALDPAFRERFMSFLEKYHQDSKATIIYVTHDVENLMRPNSKIMYVDRKIKYFGCSSNYSEYNNGGNGNV
jgi:zinc transport system ATP-binding protein